MIRDNGATLNIYSDVWSVVEISAKLDLEPTDSGDIGDLTPAGRAGRRYTPERLRYQRTYWSLTERADGNNDDKTGFVALRRLVSRLKPRAHVLSELRQNGETVIWWLGMSDSVQGGFVLEADLIGELSALGCDVYGDVYLDDDDETSAARIDPTSEGER